MRKLLILIPIGLICAFGFLYSKNASLLVAEKYSGGVLNQKEKLVLRPNGFYKLDLVGCSTKGTFKIKNDTIFLRLKDDATLFCPNSWKINFKEQILTPSYTPPANSNDDHLIVRVEAVNGNHLFLKNIKMNKLYKAKY